MIVHPDCYCIDQLNVICKYCSAPAPSDPVNEMKEAAKAIWVHAGVLTGAPTVDIVNTPPHYHDLRPHEPIDVIEHWRLSYYLGNVVKYIARHQRKGRPLEDLRKAQVYLSREIARLEKGDG